MLGFWALGDGLVLELGGRLWLGFWCGFGVFIGLVVF